LTLEELTQIVRDYTEGYHHLIEPYTLSKMEHRARVNNNHGKERSGWHVDIYTMLGHDFDQVETIFVTPKQATGTVKWQIAYAVQALQAKAQKRSVAPYLMLIKGGQTDGDGK
jgi:hypothetical protein